MARAGSHMSVAQICLSSACSDSSDTSDPSRGAFPSAEDPHPRAMAFSFSGTCPSQAALGHRYSPKVEGPSTHQNKVGGPDWTAGLQQALRWWAS